MESNPVKKPVGKKLMERSEKPKFKTEKKKEEVSQDTLDQLKYLGLDLNDLEKNE